jgi:hypothetical protein
MAIFDSGIFDSGIFGVEGEVAPPVVVAPPENYGYSPSAASLARMYDVLFPSKKARRKAKLEKVAQELIREFDPGPDLPPLDISALVAAIKLLNEPVTLKPTQAQKSAVIEALLNQAQQIRDDDEELEEIMLLMEFA